MAYDQRQRIACRMAMLVVYGVRQSVADSRDDLPGSPHHHPNPNWPH
jgi:hypothetical protein